MATVEMAFVQAMGLGEVTAAIAKDARVAEIVLVVAVAIVALADFFE